MIKFKIKTWSCDTCTYKQDFEPTIDNQNVHFNDDSDFPIEDLKENECPSCALKNNRENLITPENNNSNKTEMTLLDKAGVDEKKAKLDASVKEKIQIGITKRIESDEEKEIRITKKVEDMFPEVNGSSKAQYISELLASSFNEEIEEPIIIDEPEESRIFRVNKAKAKLVALTAKEIKDFRDKYEDK